MPTTEIINNTEVLVYTNEERAEGVTKARIAANIARLTAQQEPFADDAAYVAYVTTTAGLAEFPTHAAESYFSQFANKTVTEMETEYAAAVLAASENPEVVADLPSPTVAGVPVRVSMRQARLALFAAGKLAMVDAAINAMPSPQKEAAQIEWEYAAWIERSSPLVAALGGALEMTGAELDSLFVSAASL